jgi:hypothetical protein
MAGNLKVNLAYGDNNTISDNGITINEGLDLSVGDLGPVEQSTISIGQNGFWPLVWNTGAYNYNESGAFVFIKNEGPGMVDVQISLTSTERAGSDYEWISMGQLRPPTEDNNSQGEFIWVYLGNAVEVQEGGGGSGTPRGLRVKALNSTANVEYGIFTR